MFMFISVMDFAIALPRTVP